MGLVLVALAGCQTETVPEKNDFPVVERPTIAMPKLNEPPPPRRAGKLALLAEGENMLRLDDSKEIVEKVFPAPAGAVPFREMPPGFDKAYEVWGYETAREAFGAIFHEGGMILAMERRENLDPAIVTETVQRYIAQFRRPTTTISGDKIEYWFWEEEEGRRIMICSTADSRSPAMRDLNVAMGDAIIMDAFRMGVAQANNDVQAIEKPKPSAGN